MDPATAAFNMVAAIFQFLSTPAGQGVVNDWRDLFKGLLESANAELKAAPQKRAMAVAEQFPTPQ